MSTLAEKVSAAPERYPDNLNTPSEKFNSHRELETSFPKDLATSGKGETEGNVQNNSSSLHSESVTCKQSVKKKRKKKLFEASSF